MFLEAEVMKNVKEQSKNWFKDEIVANVQAVDVKVLEGTWDGKT